VLLEPIYTLRPLRLCGDNSSFLTFFTTAS
jgi:hypothetical protein